MNRRIPNDTQLAEIYRVNRSTIYRWRKRGANPKRPETVLSVIIGSWRFDWETYCRIEERILAIRAAIREIEEREKCCS